VGGVERAVPGVTAVAEFDHMSAPLLRASELGAGAVLWPFVRADSPPRARDLTVEGVPQDETP
jgi:hypothetical protein